MSCMVSRLLTDLTRSADWRGAVTRPERWTGRTTLRPTPVWASLQRPPGLTTLSLSHARASARYFALSYAYASVGRICTAMAAKDDRCFDFVHFRPSPQVEVAKVRHTYYWPVATTL